MAYKKQKIGSSSPLEATATTIEDLNDDKIVEILVRLPLESVFRCKCTSKRWLALTSDSSFVRSYIKRRENLKLRDHFILYHVFGNDYDFESGLYGYLPVSQIFNSSDPNTTNNIDQYPISDPSGKVFDFSFKFLPFKLEERFRSFGIVRSSHGLLLCKGILIKSIESRSSSWRRGEYYVSNPLTRQWCKIPPLTMRMSYKVGYVGFMCYSLDPQFPHKVEFIVLEIERKKHKNDEFFYARFFSSKTRRWDIYSVACPQGTCWSSGPSRGIYDTAYDGQKSDFGTIVVYQGMFHWNGGPCLIVYDPLNEPEKCKSIPIPPKLAYNGNRIELSEGCIRLATYDIENSIGKSKETYLVYELMDYNNGKWDIKFVVKSPFLNMLISFYSQTDGEISFLKSCSFHRRKFYVFNMKSESIIGEVYIPEHPTFPRQSYTADSYVMTAWPTIIPRM